MESTVSAVTLDIEQASVTAEGMQNFYWPLRLEVNVPVRQQLLVGLARLIREADGEDPDALTLRASQKYLIAGVLRLFEGVALVNAFERDGVQPVVPARFEILRALLDDSPPPCVGIPGVTSGPPSGRFPVPVRRLVRTFQWNSPSPMRLLRALSPKSGADVVTTDVNDLLVAHARRDGRALCFSPLGEWFTPGSALASGCSPACGSTRFLGRVVRVVEESFAAGGLDPEPLVGDWVRRWMCEAGAFVHSHWKTLRSKQLPREMWFSCAGATMWSAMLAMAVRAAKGYVLSHDHGYGNAQIEQTSHHITEFPFSDEFYTYNRLQAQVRRREMRAELLFDRTPPIITSPDVGVDQVPKAGDGRVVRRRGRIRRLLYLPTAFHGRRVRLRPIIPDPVALDFQARLFGHLRNWNVEVLYKPHPGGGSRPPPGFAEQFGFETDTRPFESVDWPCDAYLVDFLASTTTRDVLSSGVPTAFVHMPYPELLPEARSLLERRCTFVDVEFDSDNRIQPDWEALRAFLQQDEHVFEMTFPDAYYEGVDF